MSRHALVGPLAVGKTRPGLLAALAIATLVACSSDTRDLEMYIAEVKARPAQPIPPIPAVKTYTHYEYEGDKGRDPFQSSSSQGNEQAVSTTGGSGPRPDFSRPREYLERFELDTLSMVGTFAKDNANWALIRDPDGTVHRLSTDNYVGKNHGRIIGISESRVDISELIPDGLGGWLVRDASIALGGS